MIILSVAAVICLAAPVSADAASFSTTGKITNVKLTKEAATTGTSTYVTVKWDKYPGATEYKVYRSTTGKSGSYERLTPKITTNSVKDTGLAINTKYYYLVRACNNDTGKNRYSQYSDKCSVTTCKRTPTLTFLSTASSITVSGDNQSYYNTCKSNSGAKISYSLKDSTGNSKTDIATVNEAGNVTFKRSGTVIVTASCPATGNYTNGSKSYTLVITKGAFKYSYSDKAYTKVNGYDAFKAVYEKGTYTNTVKAVGNAVPTYQISSGSEYADIDAKTGKLTIKSTGTVTVKATFPDSDLYKGGTATYSVVIKREPQIDILVNNRVVKDNSVLYLNNIKDGVTVDAVSANGKIPTLKVENADPKVDIASYDSSKKWLRIKGKGSIIITSECNMESSDFWPGSKKVKVSFDVYPTKVTSVKYNAKKGTAAVKWSPTSGAGVSGVKVYAMRNGYTIGEQEVLSGSSGFVNGSCTFTKLPKGNYTFKVESICTAYGGKKETACGASSRKNPIPTFKVTKVKKGKYKGTYNVKIKNYRSDTRYRICIHYNGKTKSKWVPAGKSVYKHITLRKGATYRFQVVAYLGNVNTKSKTADYITWSAYRKGIKR